MEKKSFFAPSKLKAAIIYVLLLLIGAPLIGGLVGLIIGPSQGVDSTLVFQSFFVSTNDSKVLFAHHTALGWANLITYLLATLAACFYLRNYLIEDILKIKENKKKYIILFPVLVISFAAIAYGVDRLFSLFSKSSANQTTIEAVLMTSGKIPMIIATVLFAPVVEELIYRKSIFEALRKLSLVSAYITSIVCFSLPHMLSGAESVGAWFIQLLPYMILGGLLCFVYHISNHNVYVSIAAHMLNNLVAVIMFLI